MVLFDWIAIIVLVAVLATLLVSNRKKIDFQRGLGVFYVAMYRTKAGIRTMDRIAGKYKRLILFLAPFIIAVGFVGMAVVCIDLIRSIINLMATSSAPAVGVVLPVKAKGVFYVPFIYWIISIFALLIVHEGSHGVMARALGMKVKNSGLMVLGVILPIIPGAFVEPDEKSLSKASPKKQLAVYAAGPFANIVCAFLFLGLLSFVFNPVADTFYAEHVVITDMLGEGSPAEVAGLAPGESIKQIDTKPIKSPQDFSDAIREREPGDTVAVITGGTVYDVTLGKNPENDRVWFGAFVEQPVESPAWYKSAFIWLRDLVFWLFLLNLGVGLFNLVPLGPIDGGRMLLTVLQHYTPQKKAVRIWKTVSVGLLCVLLTNVFAAFF